MNLTQGSKDWLEARKSFVTATDASIIMGINPWKTPYKLWRQKMDLDPPETENEAMRRGTELEPIARAWLEKEHNIKCEPKVVIKDFMMASLDGITSDKNAIVEIKCGSKAFSSAYVGEIPNYYVCQMQTQMYVSNVQLAFYVAFNGNEGIVIPVLRDDNFINEMIPKLREFYECLISFTPPMMTTKDYQTKSDPQWKALAENYRNAYQELKNAEQLEQTLKQELIALSGEQSSMGAGIKLSKVLRKGVIEYSKIPQLTGLDLEPYRKNSSEYWKISIDV
jgi:putative phage-type endonuclease